ncbi:MULTISPECIES: hypothetical protein [unclassified Streptomyces]|uniref:hypothetical protein n=1 Tax=unclassified Streptomyces TaxID=2593676 RepID=UPI0014880A14|nr:MULTISPECIES: hypothetical protein [unclassified Streptomyces]
MTFIEFPGWQPGMEITEERANSSALVGRTVFMATRDTSQSIPSGSDSVANALVWEGIGLDLLGGWSAGQPSRWTAPMSGWYVLEGAVSFNGAAGGTVREGVWYLNGALQAYGRARTYTTTAIAASPLTVEARTMPILLSAGNYIQLVPAHNFANPDPAPLNTATGSFRPYMSVIYAGPA